MKKWTVNTNNDVRRTAFGWGRSVGGRRESGGAGPVGAAYADGQYWADTVYRVPTETVRVVVGLHYQIASREYIEFLRDENVTDNNGDLLYNLWELTGMSPPATLAEVEVQQSLWLPVVER